MAILTNQIAAVPTALELQRLMRIQVPVIVKLAERRINVNEVLKLAAGSIIEFPKASDDPMELMINNRTIGTGVAVKVGENFGIRISQIGDPRSIIEALGG